jgi:hypothetical protein
MKINLKSISSKNKKIILISFIVVLIFVSVAVILGFQIRKKQKETSLTPPSVNLPSALPESENPATAPENKNTAQPPKKSSSLNYTEMVNQYQGRRIQFTEDCQVIPNYVTFKNGTVVMFDNRANKKLPIALDGKVYYFEPYSFKILTLSSKTLPHTIVIDCGTGRNNGRILLQP